MSTTLDIIEERKFSITVLGRLLEHLGVQMYKRRTIAIAELVANCWDAGADNVYIDMPADESYVPERSVITITDDGIGMSPDQVDDEYLVVGRNRRFESDDSFNGRPVMGRKGIGKLAGFGIATKMNVQTWRDGKSTLITLNIQDLKKQAGQSDVVPIDGIIVPTPPDAKSPSGTRLVLENLKHKTALDLQDLNNALSRRFSRKVRGRMKIYVNGSEVEDPLLNLGMRVPEQGYETATLEDGSEVRYFYGFSESPIHSPDVRGFTIYARGKTAQAPPFYFFLEGQASGHYATKYLTGAIDADFLDAGIDDESDLISTDRQEIDWENERVEVFKQWGERLTRKALIEWANRRSDILIDAILNNEKFTTRIDQLDSASQRQLDQFLGILSKAEADQDRALELADALIKAYEYRHFHDVIRDIENVSEDPEEFHRLLTYLHEWKVLESRAILEIIEGRLEIIEKFHSMIVNNAPETAHQKGDDNMHDLLAEYPWLLNPEWQVLAEEKTITKQLKEWNTEDVGDDQQMRYDFLALGYDRRLVVIEIKRSGHPVELSELQRLVEYKVRLSQAHDVYMVLIYGGVFAIPDNELKQWLKRDDLEMRTWKDIYEKTRTYYEHYRAVLKGEIENPDFIKKSKEVLRTRQVLTKGTAYRGIEGRKSGIGSQDVDYQGTATERSNTKLPLFDNKTD
jgi:hypothetical protein